MNVSVSPYSECENQRSFWKSIIRFCWHQVDGVKSASLNAKQKNEGILTKAKMQKEISKNEQKNEWNCTTGGTWVMIFFLHILNVFCKQHPNTVAKNGWYFLLPGIFFYRASSCRNSTDLKCGRQIHLDVDGIWRELKSGIEVDHCWNYIHKLLKCS